MALTIKYTTGYAGTGKSTALIHLVNNLPIDSLVVLAPTHKALARVSGSLPENVEVKTIHALLGWIPSINEEALHINHIDTTVKLDKELSDYINIVIDEAGMVSEDMFMEIISKVESYAEFCDNPTDVTIHCFLDPYQLLPVKGNQILIDEENTTNLTIQYRADSPDIVELYTKFVHYLQGTNDKDLTTPYSKNIHKLDIKHFKEGDRLLAYTNDAVGAWNLRIAKHLGVTSYVGQYVQLGNKLDLVKVKRFQDLNIFDLLDLYEDGKLILQNTQINKNFLFESLKALIDNKNIQFINDGKYTYPVIVGIGNANKVLTEAKRLAIADKKNFKQVYALGRAFIMDYSYASTVHKAQGSEFKNVFIDKLDIQKSILNSYYKTYARLMYVAISRAINNIYI